MQTIKNVQQTSNHHIKCLYGHTPTFKYNNRYWLWNTTLKFTFKINQMSSHINMSSKIGQNSTIRTSNTHYPKNCT